MKLIALAALALFVGCSDAGDRLRFHPIKVHLAGGDYALLQKSVAAVLADSGAKELTRVGDSIVSGRVTIASPPANVGIEVSMKRKADGVWYEVSSEDWNDSLARKANQRFADAIADKVGFAIPKEEKPR